MSELQLRGTNLSSPIVPFTSEDVYPTHYARYGNGGYVVVDTIDEMNAIPEPRREIGMLVFCKENRSSYRLEEEGFAIASSISYNAPFYLDARQYVTVPDGKEYHEVLKDWDIPIPDGFEVFCNGTWWTYGENNPETITGKFRKRSVSGGGGTDSGFRVVVNHPSGTECCIPQNTHLDSLPLEWDCQYNSDSVSPASISIKVGNEPIIVIDNPSTGRYLLEEEIYGGTDIVITAAYGGESNSSVIHMLSTYIKYYGTLSEPIISENDMNELIAVNSDTNASLSERLFDCTGGLYPYYLIPYSLYLQVKDTLKMYVGGWMNTDFVTQSVMFGEDEYVAIRHGYIQTGKLYIKFEEK